MSMIKSSVKSAQWFQPIPYYIVSVVARLPSNINMIMCAVLSAF